MQKRNPTNHDLAKTIHDGFVAVGERFDKVENKVEIVYEYMVGEKAVANSRSNNSSLNINPEITKITLILAGIIAALVGANKIQ